MAKDATKMKTVPAFIARNQLGSILERAQKNKERFVVSRKGRATAVILGYEDFLQSILGLKEPAVLRKIRQDAQRSGASRLTSEEIEAEIRAAREEKRSKQAAWASLKSMILISCDTVDITTRRRWKYFTPWREML